ncbi:hypothetical protein GCM10027070_24890 [Barrientosiimonas humi]
MNGQKPHSPSPLVWCSSSATRSPLPVWAPISELPEGPGKISGVAGASGSPQRSTIGLLADDSLADDDEPAAPDELVATDGLAALPDVGDEAS